MKSFLAEKHLKQPKVPIRLIYSFDKRSQERRSPDWTQTHQQLYRFIILNITTVNFNSYTHIWLYTNSQSHLIVYIILKRKWFHPQNKGWSGIQLNRSNDEIDQTMTFYNVFKISKSKLQSGKSSRTEEVLRHVFTSVFSTVLSETHANASSRHMGRSHDSSQRSMNPNQIRVGLIDNMTIIWFL